MNRHLKLLIAILAVIALYALYWGVTGPRGRQAPTGASPDYAADPLQIEQGDPAPIELEFRKGHAALTPFAQYRVAARIGGRKRYSGTWQARLARYDLLLLWGRLATEQIPQLEFKQDTRWYYFRYGPDCPLDQQYIAQHSANTHVIPASDNLRRAVSRLKRDDMVLLEGYLIDLSGQYDGRPIMWNSSRTREDTGNGACEVLYLTALTKDGRIYK